MSIAHLLERFEPWPEDGVELSISEVKFEEERLQAFERGYGAGWEDAEKAQAQEYGKFTSDFANNLRELSFTYHEAHGQMVKALEPLLAQIVTSVLPEIAGKSLGPQIVEILLGAAKAAGERSVEVVVGQGHAAVVEAHVPGDIGMPVRVIEEPSLGEGQAYLRFGDGEHQIDFDDVLAGVSRAVDAFFHELDQSMESEVQDAG